MNTDTHCKIELLEEQQNSGRFIIRGVLNFDTVTGLDQEAGKLLDMYNRIIIDMSATTYVNSAGLALLLDWKRRALTTGKNIQFESIPQKLINLARMSEIEEILL